MHLLYHANIDLLIIPISRKFTFVIGTIPSKYKQTQGTTLLSKYLLPIYILAIHSPFSDPSNVRFAYKMFIKFKTGEILKAEVLPSQFSRF